MEHYVTIFNKGYIPQGLALHRSLTDSTSDFCLWVFAFDEETFSILQSEELSNMQVLLLKDYENEQLLNVKDTRSIGEYCWTLTPFLADFVFRENPQISRITYLDADLWFFNDPNILIQEMIDTGCGALITKHDYSAEYDNGLAGKYCVQFICFDNEKSRNLRQDWQKKCIEWCFDRFEDGKFGDQKYLDDWPIQFKSIVHIAASGQCLGPWNASRFPISDAIFFHFHQVRFVKQNKIHIGNYYIPNVVRKNQYEMYGKFLLSVSERLHRKYGWKPQLRRKSAGAHLIDVLRLIKLRAGPLFASKYIKR